MNIASEILVGPDTILNIYLNGWMNVLIYKATQWSDLIAL